MCFFGLKKRKASSHSLLSSSIGFFLGLGFFYFAYLDYLLLLGFIPDVERIALILTVSFDACTAVAAVIAFGIYPSSCLIESFLYFRGFFSLENNLESLFSQLLSFLLGDLEHSLSFSRLLLTVTFASPPIRLLIVVFFLKVPVTI